MIPITTYFKCAALVCATALIAMPLARADGLQKEIPKHLRAGTYQPSTPQNSTHPPVKYPQRVEENHRLGGAHDPRRDHGRVHDRGHHLGHGQHFGHGHHGYEHRRHYRHHHAAHWVPPHRVWRHSAWVTLPGFYHSAYVPPMPAPLYEEFPHHFPSGWLWVAGYWFWSELGWNWQRGNWVRL
jgi:hypothetical protein